MGDSAGVAPGRFVMCTHYVACLILAIVCGFSLLFVIVLVGVGVSMVGGGGVGVGVVCHRRLSLRKVGRCELGVKGSEN
jgi:hypothetical protein